MCEKECVKDYLPSVDVQATEGLMGKILLCMYARKAYVSCMFTRLSTSNVCWLIYNKINPPCHIRHHRQHLSLSCNRHRNLQSCNGDAQPLADSDQYRESMLQWIVIMRWTISYLTWSATPLKLVCDWYMSFSGPCIFLFDFVLKFQVTPLASISSNTCILKWFFGKFQFLSDPCCILLAYVYEVQVSAWKQ